MANRALEGKRLFVMMAALAVISSCKQKQPEIPPESPSPKAEPKASSWSNQAPAFTSAEIHRDQPLEIDTAGMAPKSSPTPEVAKIDSSKIVHAAGAPAPVTPPRPAPIAKPMPSPPTPSKLAESTKSPDSIQPGESGDWVLQVNVHRSQADAMAQVAVLAQWKIVAYAIPVPTGDAKLSGNYWRVRVGKFLSRDAAQAYGKSVLERHGLKFWIDRKSNEIRQGT